MIDPIVKTRLRRLFTIGKSLPMNDFVKRIHFVGIGGVGMSGIARVLLNLGYAVSGSDLKATELTRLLSAAGARIRIGHRAANIRGAQVVVVSSAVPAANPEVAAARKAGIPVAKRVELLAEIGALKKLVAVCGTHGKTSTTAMTAAAFTSAGADPTVIVGGQVAGLNSNARVGLGEFMIAEADESDGSFLILRPLVAIVTNIDDDHLDHYGGMAGLKAAFLDHLNHLPFYGAAVLCADDPVVRSLIPKVERPVVTYGLADAPPRRGSRAAPFWCGVRRGRALDLFREGRKAGAMTLAVPGRHNALNAVAAVAAGAVLGMEVKALCRGLESFRGVGRRLEVLGAARGIDFIDDYGHHPTEVRATISAVREIFPKKERRLVVIFQPHRFSRTKALHAAFGPALAGADEVFLTEIYPAGEKPLRGVSSALILKSLRAAGGRGQPFTRAVDLVRDLRPGDVVLTLGAGDVWKIGMDLLRRLRSSVLAPS